jgi:hypothetical protein
MGMLDFPFVICDTVRVVWVFDGKFYIVKMLELLERTHKKCKEGWILNVEK